MLVLFVLVSQLFSNHTARIAVVSSLKLSIMPKKKSKKSSSSSSSSSKRRSSTSSSSSSSSSSSNENPAKLEFSNGLPTVARGTFTGHLTYTQSDLPNNDRIEYLAAVKADKDGVDKARYDLLRLALFKGLRGEMVKQSEIKQFIPTTHPKSQGALMTQVSDTLQDLFGLDLCEKFKRKKESSSNSSNKKRKKNSQQDNDEEEDDADQPSTEVSGTRDYYVVSTLAPPPNEAETIMDSKDLEDDAIEQGLLCDEHRSNVSNSAGDVTHATRALLLTTLGLISQGEQDDDGSSYLDETTLFNRLQALFTSNLNSGKRAKGYHSKLGAVKELITTTFVAQQYIRKAMHPGKKTDEHQKVLRVYYIGQHSIHEIGMHSIYEFLTKLTDHQKDDSQWKEWGKRDSDAKAYC